MVKKDTPLLVIVGPTAAGKTAVAVEIALKIGGEIISADSMSVYKYMNIGTAKPVDCEKKNVRHHLIDVVYPDKEFSVALFKSLAENAIKEIQDRERLPIMAGGTGLFIHAVLYGFQFGEVGIDYKLRESLKNYACKYGNEALHNSLLKVDFQTAQKLHPNDQKRIIRALEIYEKTGKPMSSSIQRNNKPAYNAYTIGLYMSREKLYEKINKRVDNMLEEGLVQEVKNLLSRGYDSSMVSMQGLGYKEIISYLKGEVEYEEAICLLKRNTRRFAKRQLTWFRRDERIKWFNIEDFNYPGEVAEEIVKVAGGDKEYMSNL
ncbi:MAG: tRNA (adenosine(37)-N6)-dimethylallyltransferase MiaA [Clostridiales bacterium]|nr:tRNA (adenosine(37)-N6)-dimethylallyltransferase MiaA [Clostridiales bacterium]MCF8023269.1 tRNA (adenosine(37)-N6)-dimethylallyltransferase MiaA [Clostridiales bacterium]